MIPVKKFLTEWFTGFKRIGIIFTVMILLLCIITATVFVIAAVYTLVPHWLLGVAVVVLLLVFVPWAIGNGHKSGRVK